MYVVTVSFTARPEHVTAFKTRIVQQAAETLENEPACHVFDVCFDPEDDTEIFLYEVYETPEDFSLHLDREHSVRFDADVADWVAEKTVRTYRRL